MSRGQARGLGGGWDQRRLWLLLMQVWPEVCPPFLCSCRHLGPAAWGRWPELQGQRHQGILRASLESRI